MKNLSQSLKDSWHHATIVAGNSASAVLAVEEFLTERFGSEFASSGNPDYWHRHYDTLGVEDGRELSMMESRRPVKFPVKVFLLDIGSITTEAQNSLLKTLEEPAPETHFFLVVAQANLFLPTILSRCELFALGQRGFPSELIAEANDFLQSDMAGRLNLIKDLLKKQEEISDLISDFLNCLQKVFWEKNNDKMTQGFGRGALALSSAATFVAQRGSSPRLVLEHLAAVLPVV